MKWLILLVGLLPGAAEAIHRELGQHGHDELWWRCWMVVQLCSQFASSLSKEEVVERSFVKRRPKSRWTFDFVQRAVVKDHSLKWASWPGSVWSTASCRRHQSSLVWRRSGHVSAFMHSRAALSAKAACEPTVGLTAGWSLTIMFELVAHVGAWTRHHAAWATHTEVFVSCLFICLWRISGKICWIFTQISTNSRERKKKSICLTLSMCF